MHTTCHTHATLHTLFSHIHTHTPTCIHLKIESRIARLVTHFWFRVLRVFLFWFAWCVCVFFWHSLQDHTLTSIHAHTHSPPHIRTHTHAHAFALCVVFRERTILPTYLPTSHTAGRTCMHSFRSVRQRICTRLTIYISSQTCGADADETRAHRMLHVDPPPA